jgi:hypothetical protein
VGDSSGKEECECTLTDVCDIIATEQVYQVIEMLLFQLANFLDFFKHF